MATKTKDDIRKETLQDLNTKLEKYGKCAVIRPTGFGKTWMLTELIKKYEHVLYLYPAEVIKNTVENRYKELILQEIKNKTGENIKSYKTSVKDEDEGDIETIETVEKVLEIPNATLMTYSKLVRLKTDDFMDMDYDLIILDECHRVGAPQTKFAVNQLLVYNPKAYIVGATATPCRRDSFDVVNTYFNDITTYEYNAHDAFNDNFINRPFYCYCSYDINKDIKEAFNQAFTAGNLVDEDTDMTIINSVIKKAIVENKNILNMDNIIRTTCDEYAQSTDYMKFIVFFSSFKQMDEKIKSVESWFKNAYPDHKLNTMLITSRNGIEKDNVHSLDKLKVRPKTIDIIGCINMLNMGYHVNNLTGILMYRGTSSSIIYSQQLGRALSSGSDYSCIVFDVVDNIHRMAVYDLRIKDDETSEKTPAQKSTTTISLGLHLDDEGNVVDAKGHPAPFIIKDGSVLDTKGNPTNLTYDMTNNIIRDSDDYREPAYKRICNTISKNDIIATGHEATYRELIAKLVAEPVTQRCKQVLELHFKKWCLKNGVDYPITDADLKRFSDLSKADFRREFTEIVRNRQLDYPIYNSEKLLEIGEAANDDMVPIRLFAKLKNVQIQSVLELMGLDKEDKIA